MELELSPLWLSLKTAATATVITFFLGITAARWMVGYRGRGRGLIDGLLISPLVLPPTVVGFLLLLLFGKNGPLGQLLLQLGVSVIFSWSATVITSTVVAFPLMYKTAQGAFEQIDANLLRAARTLGASEGKVFWRIVLPLAWPGIVAGTVLAFARALGEFGATLMLAGNIPGQTQTIPVAIYAAVDAGDMKQASIWVLIVLSISLTVLTAVNYWSEARCAVGVTGEVERWGGRERGIWRNFIFNPKSKIQNPKLEEGDGGLVVEVQKQLGGFGLDVSFATAEETLGLLGASGAGKSMLLRCIAGLETPNQGRIVLNGRVLFDSNKGINLPSRDRRVGFLFQNYALFPHLNVAQNIAFGLQHLTKSERDQRVNEQLARVQLQGLGNRYPQQLSGGQQQRVALARALAIQPEALLLDEPFSALDTHLRSQLEKQMVETLATYPGVSLFVTHNLEEAYRVCKNLLVLSEGKTAAYGPKADIFERPATFTVAQLTGCKNFSRARISAEVVEALDWDCSLRVIQPIPSHLTYVGIRAHHLTFLEESFRNPFSHDESQESESTNNPKSKIQNPKSINTFPCWVAQTSETPHRITLYLKLHYSPNNSNDYHLQAEIFKEKWSVFKNQPFPWFIHLDPLRLILMEA